MKKTIIGSIMALLISGCSQQVEKEVDTKSTDSNEVVNPTAQVAKVPIGHYLKNNLHCSEQLDIRSTYALTIEQTSVTSIGINQKGKWMQSLDNATLPLFLETLTDTAKCLGMKPETLKFAQFNAPGNSYFIAYNEDNDSILRLERNRSISILVPYSQEVMKRYEVIDSLKDESAPYEPL